MSQIVLDNDEKIIFNIKRHWFYLLRSIWFYVLMLFLCIYAVIFFINKDITSLKLNIYGYEVDYKIILYAYSITIAFIFLYSFIYILYRFYVWNLRRLILTNKRLIYLKRLSLFKQKTIFVSLSKITSISIYKDNIYDFLFSVGKIVVETPSSEDEDVVVDGIYKPESIQKQIDAFIKQMPENDLVKNNKIDNNKNDDSGSKES